jgi:polysaccharide export outer membrane protein
MSAAMKILNRKFRRELTMFCMMISSSGLLMAQSGMNPEARSKAEQQQKAATSAVTVQTDGSESQTKVGPGDLLEVHVFEAPELTQAVRVDERGDAVFQLIGRVRVGDLTPEQAQDLVARQLRENHFLVNPQVSVLIQEYGTQGVSVLGEVQKPGVYPILGKRTLLDVISQAGGTTVYAGSSVTIKRNSDGQLLTIPLTKNAASMLASDVRMQPGDKIMIPRASIVYVLGDVGRPGGFLMQNSGRMTVMQAVALAGGQNRTAAMGSVRLIHKTPSGYTDTKIPLKRILDGQERDSELQAEDILYIPNSAAKSIFYRTAPSIIQSAAGAAVYGAIL